MLLRLSILCVFCLLVVNAEKLPQRVIELRGLPKSGTTWLEMILLALLSCSEKGRDISFQETAANYSREANSFIIDTGEERPMNYSLRIWLKHIISRPTTTQTVFIFRDPKDAALSFFDFSKRPVEPTIKQHTESLHWLLTNANFTVAQMLNGDYQSITMPNTFFVNYELARLCPEMVFFALADYLRLHLSCVKYALRVTSLHEMKELEARKLVPGRRHLVKVNKGEICRAIDEQRYTPLNLPADWSAYFGADENGECALVEAVMQKGNC